MKKGFTLIELSIVLVIIGFIVAGITAGGSLRESARLQSEITLVSELRIATNTFRTKTGFCQVIFLEQKNIGLANQKMVMEMV